MRLDWKQVLPALLIGGLLGGAVGARLQRQAFHRFWQRGPDTERLMRKLDRELGLDAKQKEAVRGLVDKNRDRVMALQKETSSKFGAVRKSMRSEIRKLLGPKQQEKFDAMTARWDAKRLARGDGPPGAPQSPIK